MKNRIIKIFASSSEQANITKQYPIIEKYQGFVLIAVPQNKEKEIFKKYLTEDITDQYKIPMLHANKKGGALRHTDIAASQKKTFPKGRHHYLVQFIGPIKKQWLSGVKKSGGEPRESYGGFVYIVRADEKKIKKIEDLPYVRWVGHLPYNARIESTLLSKTGKGSAQSIAQLPRTKRLGGVYTVEFFGPKDVSNAVSSIKKLGFNILEKNPKGKMIVVESKKQKAKGLADIGKLSKVHGVQKIHERALNRTSNDVAAGILGTTLTMGTTGKKSLGLSGKGEIIAICDTGLDTGDPQHINDDFAGRLAFIKSYPITPDFNKYISNPNGDDGPADVDEGHGTHVAGSVLGNGTNSIGIPGLSGPIRGLAYNAKLVFQAVEQEMKWKNPADLKENGRYLLAGIPSDLKDLFLFAYQKGARIHSNSWGGGDPGEYDEQCRQLDQFVWDHKDFCVLVAAGNDGTDKDGDGKINPMSVTSPATAKNCITIGACENHRPDFNSEVYGDWWPHDYPVAPFKNAPMADRPSQVVAFSSRGPTKDKRFKPEVISPGTFILSTRSTMIARNNTAWSAFPQSHLYFYMGGTSMATPLSAGAVALVREYLRTKKNISKPSAAMLKASLIAGAVRLPGMQPAGAWVDNSQGYGRINLDNILSPVSPATANFKDVHPGLSTGEVFTLNINIKSNKSPIRIVVAYSDFPGDSLVNNLNVILTSPAGKKYTGNQPTVGATTLDNLNNVELIHVQKPVKGAWKIEVVGSNVPHGPQDFSIVYIGHV